MFEQANRITRRRSSAGPTPPQRPIQPRPRQREGLPVREMGGGQRPTFLTLRDHGKVYVADLPRLSDGQLSQISREAQEMLDSLTRRLAELAELISLNESEQDTRIRAGTKRDVTERFLAAIAQEQELRRSNPALRAAAGESLARAFLELARHRLPGSTFDSLLQEALAACNLGAGKPDMRPEDAELVQRLQRDPAPQPRQAPLPVVLTPDLSSQAA